MKRVQLIIFSTLLAAIFGNLNAAEAENTTAPYIDKKLKANHLPYRAESSKTDKTAVFAETQKEQNSSFLRKIGISIEDEKIIVDTKKSRDFFIDLGAKIQHSFEKVMKKRDKNSSAEEDAGIRISDDKMVIDFNRTKKYIDRWVDTIEVLTDELGHTLDESFGK